MLPLFVIIMMFLMITYELVDEMITVEQEIRYELRKSVDIKSPGSFEFIEESKVAFLIVRGRMKNVLGRTFIGKEIRLSSYGGCYQGSKLNKYRRRVFYREIERI